MSVVKHILRGHKDSVISLFNTPGTDVVLSSSDDHTVRLWDTRLKYSAQRLFKVNSESDIGFVRATENILTVSCGGSTLGFDLRKVGTIIAGKEDTIYSTPDGEDINDFCISNGSLFLPSDSGHIRQVSLDSFCERTSLQAHGSIAGVCRVLPCGDQLISGGYDCRISTSRFSREQIDAGKGFDMSSVIPIDEDSEAGPSNESINPPFVTCIEISPNQDQVAIGSGDGSVLVFELRKGGSKIDSRRAAWGGSSIHPISVACIAWSMDGSSVWSAGNDSVLNCMNECRISVKYPLGYKPNSIVELGPGRVAVAGTVNEIEILELR
jgi:WD40 repeat protein